MFSNGGNTSESKEKNISILINNQKPISKEEKGTNNNVYFGNIIGSSLEIETSLKSDSKIDSKTNSKTFSNIKTQSLEVAFAKSNQIYSSEMKKVFDLKFVPQGVNELQKCFSDDSKKSDQTHSGTMQKAFNLIFDPQGVNELQKCFSDDSKKSDEVIEKSNNEKFRELKEKKTQKKKY